MNKELELEVKLHLLHLAGGDPDHAQQMLDWLLLPAKNEEDTTIKIEPDAIAALSPAPSEGDALAEFMKREGAVKWEGGKCPVEIGTHIEVLTRKTGVWPVIIKPEAPLLWEREGHDLDIIAYRVLPSEPAAEAKGEAEEIDEGDPGMFDDDPDFQPITISASEQHAEESARANDLKGTLTTEQAPEGALNFLITEHQDKHAPLFPPEPPPAATPEQLEATGVIDGEAGWWARKLAKEPA